MFETYLSREKGRPHCITYLLIDAKGSRRFWETEVPFRSPVPGGPRKSISLTAGKKGRENASFFCNIGFSESLQGRVGRDLW